MPERKTTTRKTTTRKKSTPAKETTAEKSIDVLADEVLAGTHGSGLDRMASLGSRYVKVQAEVNKRSK